MTKWYWIHTSNRECLLYTFQKTHTCFHVVSNDFRYKAWKRESEMSIGRRAEFESMKAETIVRFTYRNGEQPNIEKSKTHNTTRRYQIANKSERARDITLFTCRNGWAEGRNGRTKDIIMITYRHGWAEDGSVRAENLVLHAYRNDRRKV